MEVGKEGSNDREVCRQVLAPADALGAGSETGRQGTDLVPDVHGFCNIHLGRHELRYGFLVCIVPNETIAGFVGDEGIAGTVLGSTGCVGHGLQVLYGVAGE